MFKIIALATATSLALVSAAASAPKHSSHRSQMAEQPKQRLGTLSCAVAGGVGLLIGSNRSVDCTFRQRTGKTERYTGSIGRLGLDVGVTGKRYMSWIVVNTAPTRVGEGVLAGTYIGASASASVGLGLGANALIGGNAKNLALQPISGEAGTGLNIAAGVSQLKLERAG